ncbi:MAG: hypothetical protein M3209_12535 [Acidobacteriota bacterium]|nr:hypothetical protein [Acidobacteriota bacterium]
MRKEKTVITVETFRRTVVRLPRKEIFAFCEVCRRSVSMLAPDEAGRFRQTTVREIFRLVETGELHFLETATGILLICRDSLESAQKL